MRILGPFIMLMSVLQVTLAEDTKERDPIKVEIRLVVDTGTKDTETIKDTVTGKEITIGPATLSSEHVKMIRLHSLNTNTTIACLELTLNEEGVKQCRTHLKKKAVLMMGKQAYAIRKQTFGDLRGRQSGQNHKNSLHVTVSSLEFPVGFSQRLDLQRKLLAGTLVKDLGADAPKTRRTAQERLEGLGESARNALQTGLKSEDPEMRGAAKKLLDALGPVRSEEPIHTFSF